MRNLIAALIVMLSARAYGEGIPCWIRCRCPPTIVSPADVPGALRRSSNPPVRFPARALGILSTYLGKMLGVQGWHDYHLVAKVTGKVVQSTWSSDGFYTIDLRIKQLQVKGQAVALPDPPRFIRIEVLPFVRIGAPLPASESAEICVLGKLTWDGDGFLEIHPSRAHDITRGPCAGWASANADGARSLPLIKRHNRAAPDLQRPLRKSKNESCSISTVPGVPPIRVSPASTPASQQRARWGPRVAVHVAQLLSVLIFRPHVEIVETFLPNRSGMRAYGMRFP